MSRPPLLRKVDAVTFHVPDLDAGLRFYRDRLGHELLWRNDEGGQAALAMPESDTEIVLTTEHGYEPNWLVDSADEAADRIEQAGGKVLAPALDIPVGKVAVVEDPSAMSWCSSTSRRAATASTTRGRRPAWAEARPARRGGVPGSHHHADRPLRRDRRRRGARVGCR